MDKRMQRAKINAGSTLLSQLVTTAVGVVIPWIMIGHFGSEAYGATTSIAQFLSYIALFEGGIGRVARGALYGPLAAGDEGEISRIYLAVKRFFSIIGAAFLGYTLLLAFFYYDIAQVTAFSREYVFGLVLVIAISKFAEYMWGISNITLLNADQRQYVVNSVTILSNVLNVIAISLLISFGADILWVKLASSLVFILKPVIFTLYLKTHYSIKKSKTRAVLANKATGIAQHMAYVVQNNTDVLILTVLADLKMVAVYSIYHMITFSIRNIVTSFTGGMEAVLGEMIAKGEEKALWAAYKRYKMLLSILVIAFFGATAILIVPFVKLYTFGVADVEYARPVFAVLMVMAEAMNCLVLPCFNLTIAANKLKESQMGAYSEAAINVIVSVALVFWDPLIGVAVGTLVSTVVKCIFYIVFSGKHILRANVSRMLLRFAGVMGILLGVSVLGIIGIQYVPVYNYWRWIPAGLCTFLITLTLGALSGCLLYPDMARKISLFRRKTDGGINRSEMADAKASGMYEPYSGHDIAAYAGYVNDRRELMECSSGGVATALARAVIRRGGYVAGVRYSRDFMEAEYEIVHREEDISRFRGSKYVDVRKGSVYKDVQALLDAGETVLFFGLPCVVAALRSFLGREYDRLIAVELICHGPTLPKVHRQYVEYLQKKYNSRVVDFSVKKKMDAWTPGYLYAEFENGQIFREEFYHTEYGYAFSVLAKKACYTCSFRGNNRTGDLMIGDFWGAVEGDAFWNKDGVSSILVHTEKGRDLLLAAEELQLYPTTFERIVEKNPNVIHPRRVRPETAKFEKLLEEHDLFYAAKHSKRLRTRLKAFVKRILFRVK